MYASNMRCIFAGRNSHDVCPIRRAINSKRWRFSQRLSSPPLKGSVTNKGGMPHPLPTPAPEGLHVDQRVSRMGRIEGLLYRTEGHM